MSEEAYEQRETNLGAPQMRQVERRVILTVLDRAWREHLYEMDQLRDGIGLRAVGQRDPLVEYKREAFFAFETVQARIKEEAVGYIFNMPTERMQMPAEQVTLQAQAPAAPLEPVIPHRHGVRTQTQAGQGQVPGKLQLRRLIPYALTDPSRTAGSVCMGQSR